MAARLQVTFYNGPADEGRAANHCARGVFAESVHVTPDGALVVAFKDHEGADKVTTIPADNVAAVEFFAVGR